MPNFTPKEDDIKVCSFPKYRDVLWSEVVEEDRKYVEWILYGDHDLVIKDTLVEYLEELLEESS